MGLSLSVSCLLSLISLVLSVLGERSDSSIHHHDYCVLGAGPAGLQMGYFLSRSQRDYIILERNSGPGSFFRKFPRHRKLISINKIFTGRQNREFNLRHDWNSLLSHRPDLLFQRFSQDLYPKADVYPHYLSVFAQELGLQVKYNTDIGNIQALQFEGSGHKGYMLTDQHGVDYKCRAVNNELLDTYQLKSLDGLVEGRLEDIAIVRGVGMKRRAGKKTRRKFSEKKEQLYLTLSELLDSRNVSQGTNISVENLPGYHDDNFSLRQPYDRVIRCLGFRFNFTIFNVSACPPRSSVARGRMPTVTAWYEGRGTPNLFILGTAAHSRDYRMSAGGFIHGFRYTVRAVHKVLDQRYHNNAWPVTKLHTSHLLPWILNRVNEASGPYQMFGVLGDIVLLQGAHCEYLEEFPVQALPHFAALSGRHVSQYGILVVIMQYGMNHTDTLGPGRAESEWTNAWKSNFLHPVIYYYRRLPTERDMKQRPAGWLLPRPDAVHHMVEDFLTEWDQPVSHSQPLRRFLEHCLQTDLRAFYAESCFQLSLTNLKPPIFCLQGYLNKGGIVGNRHLWQHAHEAGLMPKHHRLDLPANDGSFSENLSNAGATVTSTINSEL
ncbi:FAD-dependent oxidoreductase domain-containing protein 2 isoform X3 [Silurus meridionalis]|uniref:FAD-dependent oxidoreductase domain-containing protein 2 isoform X3 n=1 Tax=Silurus meridionalis TaxID=175797 RepID=UPI001EEC4CC1|nr:FAD-dependent oxidoreductase domain-containing protein 2 isoform X3 [Silurus meridionalis]